MNIAKIIPGITTGQVSADGSSVADRAHQPTEIDIELSKRIKSIEKPHDDNFVPFTLTTNILKTKRYQLPESATKIEKYRYTLSPKDTRGDDIKYAGSRLRASPGDMLLEDKENGRHGPTDALCR